MKRLFPCLLLLAFLLTGCRTPRAAVSSTTTAASTAEAPASLVGVWINAGQYSDGRDFVETLTLNRDGTASVHLEYQGADYATLEGTWTADGDTLVVDFTDPNTRDRTYAYVLTDRTLTLTGEGKNVEYVRE